MKKEKLPNTIKSDDLLKALEIVKPGLSSQEKIEQTTSFAFINGRVITYDDSISISHPIPDLKFTGVIKAEELYKLLSKLKGKDLIVDSSDSEIILKSGRMKSGLTIQNEITLPIDEEIQIGGDWKKLPKSFLRNINFAQKSCSTNMTEPIYTCVNVNKNIVEASDSLRIARCQLSKKMPVKPFLLPASSIPLISKLNPVYIAFGINGGWIHFKTKDDTIISSRIQKNKYPNLSKYLEVEGISFTFPENLLEILERAEIFASRDVKLDEEIEFNIGNNKLSVKSKSESGWFSESLKIKYNDDPFKFIIPPDLLKSILKETTDCIICENRLKFIGDDWEYISVLKVLVE